MLGRPSGERQLARRRGTPPRHAKGGRLASDERMPPYGVGSGEPDATRASDLTLAVNRCHAAVLTVSTGPLRSVVFLIAITAGP